ncbi:trypsin-like serine peptidase [Laceyella putida]|uniref:Serine protease n=1 Tax=Laceyella putida TaxID=110101 RepID=A0ABW2RGS7_9BACL
MSKKKGIRFTLLSLAMVVALVTMVSAHPASAAWSDKEEVADPHQSVSRSGQAVIMRDHAFDDVVKTKDGAYAKGAKGTGMARPEQAAPSGPVSVKDMGYKERESIIGRDDRTQVTNTGEYPYRAIVYIEFEVDGNRASCSGFLIDPDTVATAGHCVYDPERKRWAEKVKVYPGRNGSDAPYGYAEEVDLYTVDGWKNQGDENFDYGAIKLNREIGNEVGWFGYRWQSNTLVGTKENISGYPGDKPTGTQWQHSDEIRQETATKLFYANDTYGGQSGSPVYNGTDFPDCGICAIAIHAYGTGWDRPYNSGTRMNESIFNNLTNWKNQ